jgi:hypothetical protein
VLSVDEQKARWFEEAVAFQGDQLLFWAGKMSEVTAQLRKCTYAEFAYWIDLLSVAAHEYDVIIDHRMLDEMAGAAYEGE